MDPDERAIAQVASGDADAALAELYERHARSMLGLLRRLTSDASVAEEILQESWLAVWQSAGSYRGQASVRSWLLGIARRQAHNRLRKVQPERVAVEEAAEVAAEGPSVEETALADLQHDLLVEAIDGLPGHLREVLVLVLGEDLSYPEVAHVLDIPVGTVKSRMSLARRRLASTPTISAWAGTAPADETRGGGGR